MALFLGSISLGPTTCLWPIDDAVCFIHILSLHMHVDFDASAVFEHNALGIQTSVLAEAESLLSGVKDEAEVLDESDGAANAGHGEPPTDTQSGREVIPASLSLPALTARILTECIRPLLARTPLHVHIEDHAYSGSAAVSAALVQTFTTVGCTVTSRLLCDQIVDSCSYVAATVGLRLVSSASGLPWNVVQ